MARIHPDWQGRSRFWYGFIHALVSLIVRTGLIRLRVSGQRDFPESGPVLLLGNHQSNLDPLLIGWPIPRPLNIPAKIELFGIPGLRFIVKQLGSYPVDRDAKDSASLRRSLQVLRRGRVLAMFPEGTRTRSGVVGPFAPTIARLAVREGIPIVPVAINGSGRILAPERRMPRLGVRVSVKYGPPFELLQFQGRKLTDEDLDEAANILRQHVVDLLESTETSPPP